MPDPHPEEVVDPPPERPRNRRVEFICDGLNIWNQDNIVSDGQNYWNWRSRHAQLPRHHLRRWRICHDPAFSEYSHFQPISENCVGAT